MLKKLALILIIFCGLSMAKDVLRVIDVDSVKNGSFTLLNYYSEDDAAKLYAGEVARIQVKPAKGYVLDTLYATYGEGQPLKLVGDSVEKSVFTFTVPNADVSVKGSFKLKTSSITVEKCNKDELTCSFPSSATYGDTVGGSVSGNFRDMQISSIGVSPLHLIQGTKKDSVWFVMDESDVTIVLDYQMIPTKFELKVTCNIEGKCNLPDSANVGDSVSLTIETTAKYENIEVGYSGLDQKDFKTVEAFKHYKFAMPENDVVFTVFGTKMEEDTTGKSADTSGTKVDTVYKKDTTYIKDTTSYYEVNIVKSDSGEIRKEGVFVRDHENSTFKGEEIKLHVQPKQGYAVDAVTVKKADGTKVTVTKDGECYKFTMPASKVNVSATYKMATYKITTKNCVDLKCEVPATAKYGEKVTLTVTMLNGVTKFNMTMDDIGDYKEEDLDSKTVYTFTMPPYDVEFSFEDIEKGGESGSSTGDGGKSSGKKDTVYVNPKGEMYSVTIANSDKGTIERLTFLEGHPDEMSEGAEVSLWVSAKTGYALDSLIIKTGSKDVKWTKEDNHYKFTMPAGDVKISATYKDATYKVELDCGESKCVASKTTAKYGEKITVTATLAKGKSISYTKIPGLKSEQVGKDLVFTFTMPANDVKFFVDGDDDSGSKDDGKSSDSKDDGKSGSKDDGKSDKGDKDAVVAMAKAPVFSANVQNRMVYVSGAAKGSAYTLLNMSGSVVAKGRVDSTNFSVAAPNAGKYFLRVGGQVRALDVK